MNRTKSFLVLSLVVLTVFGAALAGCGSKTEEAAAPATPSPSGNTETPESNAKPEVEQHKGE